MDRFCGRKIKKSIYLSIPQIFPLPCIGVEAAGGGPENVAGEEGTESSGLCGAGECTQSSAFRSLTRAVSLQE